MNTIAKLGMLSSSMDYETAEDVGCPKMRINRTEDIYITNAVLPNGKRVPLLKTLLTSVCERNCNYCPFRTGRDFRRTTIKPHEMAKIFFSLYQSGIVEGLFLSSGLVGGGEQIQDRLIDTVEILRSKYKFKGYIHLKIMPGAQYEQVLRSLQIADRISINLEAPNEARLKQLAPLKKFNKELVKTLKWIEYIRRNQEPHNTLNGKWPSTTTQFVVGPAEESDLELLATTEHLFKKFRMRRIYYRAFNPSPDTPFENHPATLPLREHRLYQASYLLRDYNFNLEDIAFMESGNLTLEIDPKTAWAHENLKNNPIEINHASPLELLRIPGFGPKAVNNILSARKKGILNDASELHRIGIRAERAIPFLLMNGKKPIRQLSLF
jgi:predicted DNA-binding helix-hairpin-helix protein